MEISAKLKHRILVLKWMFPNCYREVDGGWVWWCGGDQGAVSPADLKVMAEILQEANRTWDAQVGKDLG